MWIQRRQWWRAASLARWRIPTKGLVAVVIVLTALLAVAMISEVGSVRDLPASVSAPSAPQPIGGGQYTFFPRSSHVTLGIHYRFALYTHCGLDWPVAVDFDGSFWSPTGPGPASDGSGNPPSGFGNPIDHGIMTLLSPNVAEYRTSSGTVMRFSRRTGSQRAFICS